MKIAERPDDEKERVADLYTYDIVDTIDEEEYDNITKIASFICGTPVSLITMMEEERQWIKSAVGTEVKEVPRDISFCSHLLTNGQSVIFPDLQKNPDFADHPFVAGPLQVGFYAGVPIVSPAGHAIGSICVLDTRPRELTDEQTHALGALAKQVMMLLSYRKNLRESKQLHTELQESFKDLQTFSYMVSHDLKAPLRSIRGFSEIIEEDYGESLEEEIKYYLNKVQDSAARMDVLIDDLLNLSRVSRQEVKKEEVDFTEICRSVAADYNSETFKVETEGGLHTVGDRGLITAVARNLISNAVKYSGKNPEPAVSIYAEVREGKQYFCIRDNGVGFNPDRAGDIWRPFRRMHTEKEFSGTGIGLAIVKKAVDKHHGHAFFESAPGEGAKFYVRFQN